MKTVYLIVLMLLLITSCAPSESAILTPIAETIAAIPSQTAYPTQTSYPTYTALPPIIITATLPRYTATPKPTLTPKPTENPELTTDKIEGVWLVGDEVAPGKWRAIGGDCYMVTKDSNGNQMGMESGSGSVIVVPANAFTVEFISFPGYCTWKYLGK